ncbi:STAS/SEC14 domain-containing protein [Halomonas sp. ATCH28]|uniref:STAS/SEC14 domain-containing protein n=1 Tax=Halomonas gemina TaxID=2945105 RepID=A0ABT0T0A0_9GAMM|nr:STAS/SEC14 domain-containing protein [Halomonas gemina]MCL7939966.1 STAS/SEC14 domain-containing protein [Halomonas gemina]
MLEFITHSADHVVAMKIGGVVSARELQQAIDAIEAAKRNHPRISLLAELDGLRWMTLTALLKDVGYGLTQLGDLERYQRVAVITDKEWIKHLAHLEDHLFKSVDIHTFPHREYVGALSWVGELPRGEHENPEEDGYHGA